MSVHLSGTVRFSVESLLYYAPKITSTGEALASAVDTAQRELLDLGDFYGHSWPDEPFRDSYPRCQYAMLIIARQIADEIQGIGGGIEQMARTYGITENQNVADVQRIHASQGQTAARISHEGGLPAPPVVASGKTVPAKSANPFAPHPDPQPNAAPHAPASIGTTSAAVPAENTPESYVSAAPHRAGPLLPDPQPGVDPTTWNPRDAASLLGPWPSGDPDKMDQAAACWTTLTRALDEAWTDLQRYTAYIMADAQGPAADAFQDYVDGLTGHGHGLLFRAIDMAQELRDTCTKQASSIREIKSKLEETLAEIAATFVIGQVLSMLTFGAAEDATAAVEAGLTAKLTQLAGLVAEHGIADGEKLDAIAVSASKVVAAATVSSVQSTMIGAGDVAATDIIGHAFGEKPVQGTAALKQVAESGGVGGLLSGLINQPSGEASRRLIALGERIKNDTDHDPQVGSALMTLGRQLKNGGTTVSVAHAAAAQLITQHKITPLTLITGTISSRFTTAISPSTGKHAQS